MKKLLEQYGASAIVRDVVARELMRLVRDYLGWNAVLEYVDTLPGHLARSPLVLEQQAPSERRFYLDKAIDADQRGMAG